jgi:hypothetical protein
MDNIIKAVYELFEQKNSELTNAGLQPVRTIDRYRGQTLNPEQFELYGIPAIFIQWGVKWNMVGKTYTGEVSLAFHVVTDEPWETANIYVGSDDALKKAFFHTAVQRILDDLQGPGFNKIQRSEDAAVDTGVICYTILGYTTTIYDNVGIEGTLLDDIAINLQKGNLKKKLD